MNDIPSILSQPILDNPTHQSWEQVEDNSYQSWEQVEDNSWDPYINDELQQQDNFCFIHSLIYHTVDTWMSQPDAKTRLSLMGYYLLPTGTKHKLYYIAPTFVSMHCS
jgi:hypothetical protein